MIDGIIRTVFPVALRFVRELEERFDSTLARAEAALPDDNLPVRVRKTLKRRRPKIRSARQRLEIPGAVSRVVLPPGGEGPATMTEDKVLGPKTPKP
jgi:hypothetical protein